MHFDVDVRESDDLTALLGALEMLIDVAVDVGERFMRAILE